MDIYELFMEQLFKAVEKEGNLHKFAEKTNLAYSSLYRWYSRQQIPSLSAIMPLLPYLEGFDITPANSSKNSYEIKQLKKINAQLKEEITVLKVQISTIEKILDKLLGIKESNSQTIDGKN